MLQWATWSLSLQRMRRIFNLSRCRLHPSSSQCKAFSLYSNILLLQKAYHLMWIYLCLFFQRFFFKSQVIATTKFKIGKCEDFVWVTKDELLEYFPEQAEVLSKMIISWCGYQLFPMCKVPISRSSKNRNSGWYAYVNSLESIPLYSDCRMDFWLY